MWGCKADAVHHTVQCNRSHQAFTGQYWKETGDFWALPGMLARYLVYSTQKNGLFYWHLFCMSWNVLEWDGGVSFECIARRQNKINTIEEKSKGQPIASAAETLHCHEGQALTQCKIALGARWCTGFMMGRAHSTLEQNATDHHSARAE